MDTIVTGYPEVDLSITNPNVSHDDALDKFTPFSFVQFIETVSESYQPETLTEFYNTYLNRWNTKTNKKSGNNKDIIIDRYRDFLKDITLNFSTTAERTFLTQLDFSDPYDVEIAMSFYSKKIRHIISYYKKKRQTLYYVTTKSKVKGSSLGVEQAAIDLVINFLENRSTAARDYDITKIKNNLSISITEYFDNFSQYFNRAPEEHEYGKTFKSYDPAGLPKDNIFLADDETLVSQVFATVGEDLITLKEGRQTLNFNVKDDSLFSNKRDLTEKFMGADFYYLATDENGKPNLDENGIPPVLFKAKKPYANFLNQDFPSTASVFSNDIVSERDLGFFRPHNSAIVVIEGRRLNFFTRKIYPPNQLYIFPDPNLFTNTENVLTFIIDTSRSINNASKGIAVNQPNTDRDSTAFIGYNSKMGQDRNLNTDLSYLFDEGYIDDSKKDLFGNIFGLVKDYNYYRNNVVLEAPVTIKSLMMNGYQFFDDLYGEGYTFSYETSDSSTFSETIRSGLSTFTNGFTGRGPGDLLPDTPSSWTSFPTSAYNIFFRYFNPYQTLLQPSNFLEVDYNRPTPMTFDADVKEGAYFKFSDTEALTDPMRSGLSAYAASTAQFYFSELTEAGIGEFNVDPPYPSNPDFATRTIFRALCDNTDEWTESLSGNFTYDVRLSGGSGNSGNDVKNYDGMLFTDNIIFNYAPNEENFDYNSTVYSKTTIANVTSAHESFFNKQDHLGKIYVKNINKAWDTPAVKELTEWLPYLSVKYNNAVCNELSSAVTNFDIFYSTLFVETSSYLVIERTKYKDNKFQGSGSFTNSITLNTNFFDKVSNRLKVEDDVFYCKMVREQLGPIDSDLSHKGNRFYPEIYKYNYIKDKSEQIFPTTGNPAVSSARFFNLTGDGSVYIECSTPLLTYSSDNEQFNLGVILKDQNKGPVLLNYLFEYTDDITFLNSEAYACNNSRFTYNFVQSAAPPGEWATIDLDNLNFVLSSAIPSLTSTYVSPSPLSASALIL